MKFFTIALMAGAASAFTATESTFLQYLMSHGKNYKSIDEFEMRYSVFQGRYNRIMEINAREKNFTLGANKFTDWTQDEIDRLMGYKEPENFEANVVPRLIGDVPASVDWRDSGCETPVKDQGHCGSCWTFATIESVESAWCLATGELPLLSAQQLVDCVGLQYVDDDGCNGGWTYDAYDYLTNQFAYSEEAWPYTATDGECTYNSADATNVHLSGYAHIPRDIQSMKASVATRPMAISIEAGQDIFHQYTGGIIDSTDCGYQTDHAVVTVGYGTDADSGLEYWLVRNSWGTDWGEDGFVRIAITDYPVNEQGNLLGICGIGRRPLTAFV